MENTQNKTMTEEEKKSLRLKRFTESALNNASSTKVKLNKLKLV